MYITGKIEVEEAAPLVVAFSKLNHLTPHECTGTILSSTFPLPLHAPTLKPQTLINVTALLV